MKVFDPAAMEKAKRILKKVEFCRDAYEVAKGSDCLVILTEWNEFKERDLKKIKRLLKTPVIVDGRNIYDPERMKKMGLLKEMFFYVWGVNLVLWHVLLE